MIIVIGSIVNSSMVMFYIQIVANFIISQSLKEKLVKNRKRKTMLSFANIELYNQFKHHELNCNLI